MNFLYTKNDKENLKILFLFFKDIFDIEGFFINLRNNKIFSKPF
jgi:hypothetical protein